MINLIKENLLQKINVMLTKNQIKKLPNTIGLYIFKNDEVINYIGKSVNIKARVLSHLENAKIDNKERLIIENSNKIETIITESEFKALLLESKLIREFQPKYNSIWKDDKSPLYIQVTTEVEYPKVLVTRKPSLSNKSLYFGPFSSVRMVEKIINDIRKIIPFCTQKKLSKNACFYSKIGLCNPCTNEIGGCKGEARLALKDQYEKKIIVRNKIFRFGRLLTLKDDSEFFLNNNTKNIKELFSLLRKYFPQLNKLNRIETYDISNLGLKQAVGSMIVMKNNQIDKKEYRKFKIKKIGLRSDFDRLKEVMFRRIKQNWPVPDLVIIDGGKPQIRAILKIFHNNGLNIPLIGIVKNPDRVIIGLEDY